MVKNQIANSSNQIAILAFGSNRSDWNQIKISVLITIVLCRLFEMCNVYMYCSRRTRWTGCRPWQHHTMTTSAFSSCWHSQSPAFTRSSSSIIIHNTHPFNGPLSGTTWVSRYQKFKINLDFTEARDSEWQLHQLGYMQVCISLQTSTPAPHHLLFYRPDALPAAQPTASKHCVRIKLPTGYFFWIRKSKSANFYNFDAHMVDAFDNFCCFACLKFQLSCSIVSDASDF